MKRLLFLIPVCLALFGLTGGLRVSAQDTPLKVVASFSILADVVKNVGLNHVEVTSLIPVGADPHGYEPSAQDLRVLADADVVFVVGANFEEALLEAITNSVEAGVPVIEASACVQIRAFGVHGHEESMADTDAATHDSAVDDGLSDVLCEGYESYLTDLNDQKGGMVTLGMTSPEADETLGRLHDIDCRTGHDDGVHESDDHHDHEDGGCDPHVWTNPYNVYLWTLFIRDSLTQVDAANADFYAANAEEYLYQLIDHIALNIVPLIDSIPPEHRILVTNHETLGYFSATYGFEMVGFVLPGGSAFAEPSAQDIAGLVDLIRAEGVPAVFAENTISANVAQQVAGEAGIAFYSLYTDSLSASGGEAATYLDYLTYNVQTMARALSWE